jgi:hypothetical protein
MREAERVARGLSEAQKDALLGKFSWSTPMDQEDGEAELYHLGIWGPHGGRSPLGLEVRSILKGERDAE